MNLQNIGVLHYYELVSGDGIELGLPSPSVQWGLPSRHERKSDNFDVSRSSASCSNPEPDCATPLGPGLMSRKGSKD